MFPRLVDLTSGSTAGTFPRDKGTLEDQGVNLVPETLFKFFGDWAFGRVLPVHHFIKSFFFFAL